MARKNSAEFVKMLANEITGKYVWKKIKKDPAIPDEPPMKTMMYQSPETGKQFHVSPAAADKSADLKGFVSDIEKDTKDNDNFRKVLYTGKNSQLVLMALKPGEEIGEEVHDDTDQFFRVDSGEGKVVINGKEKAIKNGSAVVVPQGAKHNVINTGKTPLKVYTIYSPPHHKDGIIHKTKEEAEADKEDHFDGGTTEK